MTTRAPRLLIIDDSALMRRVVSELAVEAGFTVVGEAADGLEGVVAAIRLKPDVVVMDWQMPELDGVAATRAIHERDPSVEVIAYSSGDEDPLAAAFLAAGASAYVPKADIEGLALELLQRAKREIQ